MCSACLAGDSVEVSLKNKISDDNRINTVIALRMDSLFKVLSEEEGFNGNVLVAKEGKIIYEHSFGYADLRERTPLDIKSIFEIGSVTKQFTAMAIMILHDEGKLRERELPLRPRFDLVEVEAQQRLLRFGQIQKVHLPGQVGRPRHLQRLPLLRQQQFLQQLQVPGRLAIHERPLRHVDGILDVTIRRFRAGTPRGGNPRRG